MRNYKSKISFEDYAKFAHILYYWMEGVLHKQVTFLPFRSSSAPVPIPLH